MTHADKRKVSTDALETLGTILTRNEKRDAIHLAVLPVIAGQDLDRACLISLQEGRAFADSDGLGIVDPFVEVGPRKGEKFWMVLKPRIIQSLRHVWTHPDLPDESAEDEKERVTKIKESEQWLRNFCEDYSSNAPSDYDTMIEKALESEGDEYMHFNQDAYGSIPSEFWDHLETVTGVRIKNPPKHFSCSC